MGLKIKLISCISAVILVLGIMLVGVLAADQVQVNIGGSVSFTASSVHAEISGSVQGSVTTNTLPTVTVDASTPDGALDMGNAWKNMVLDFNEAGDDIIITVNIKNLSDRSIKVTMNDTTSISNVQVTRTADGSALSSSSNTQIIEGVNTVLTYKFTLHIQSKDTSVTGGKFILNMDLANYIKTGSNVKMNILLSSFSSGYLNITVNGEQQRYDDKYGQSFEFLNVEGQIDIVLNVGMDRGYKLKITIVTSGGTNEVYVGDGTAKKDFNYTIPVEEDMELTFEAAV